MREIFNHLWQSTAFAVLIVSAAMVLRRNSPRLRYWLWLAASVKFLIPFSLIVSTGARLPLPHETLSPDAATVVQISTYFEPVSELSATVPGRPAFPWGTTFAALWLIGISLLLFRWFRRWRTIHRAAGRATMLPFPSAVPIFSSPVMIEPGVFGLFRPVLLLPEGIADSLTPKQFEAIVAHELRHIQCFDNLTAAVHMGIETLFWFHPLVWWIGGKLMDERERDCDEAVLRQGRQPGDYARGIVHVCETYVKTELSCASGISGSDLKKRVREIMTWRASLPVTLNGKAILASVAIAALLVPFVVGVMRSQSKNNAPMAFEVTSVKMNKSGDRAWEVQYLPGGRFSARNIPLVFLILQEAYHLPPSEISLGRDLEKVDPDKIADLRYDVEAVASKGAIPPTSSEKVLKENLRLMLQSLLADRFKLTVHREVKEEPVYALMVAKGGPKFPKAAIREKDCEDKPSTDPASCHVFEGGAGGGVGSAGTGIRAEAVDMSNLSIALSNFADRLVIDRTGLKGLFNVQSVPWVPLNRPPLPPGTEDRDSRVTMSEMLDLLGLKLEARKAQVEVLFIDHFERPLEN
jgi:uncharacterized protein (TIGR03435 family)